MTSREAERLSDRTEPVWAVVASDLSWVERTDPKARVQFIDAEDAQGRIVGFVAAPMRRAHRTIQQYVTWTCLIPPCYPSAVRAASPAEAAQVFSEHCRVAHQVS